MQVQGRPLELWHIHHNQPAHVITMHLMGSPFRSVSLDLIMGLLGMSTGRHSHPAEVMRTPVVANQRSTLHKWLGTFVTKY